MILCVWFDYRILCAFPAAQIRKDAKSDLFIQCPLNTTSCVLLPLLSFLLSGDIMSVKQTIQGELHESTIQNRSSNAGT